MRKSRFTRKGLCVITALACFAVYGATNANAFTIGLGEDASLDVDVSLAYNAGWRLKDPDKKLISDTSAPQVDILTLNADDGNRNFEKGDMFNNRVSSTIDIDLQYKDFGVFVRPRAYYDWAYDGSNSNDDPLSNNNMDIYGGSLTSTDQFSEETQEQHRDKVEILDAFIYGSSALGDHDVALRAGRQVVSWGESLFIQNGVSSAMAPVDVTAASVPGVAVKELFLPVEQVSAQVNILPSLDLAGFYQWRWEKNRNNEVGSYFSPMDTVDEAGERMLYPVALTNPGLPLAATIDRTSDETPRDSGQWGVALNYTADALGSADIGLYYINYHEKNPMTMWQWGGGSVSPAMAFLDVIGPGTGWENLPPIPGTPPGFGTLLNMVDLSSYYLSYAEDVRLIGASIGGVIGETNVALEVSHRSDMPVAVADPLDINPLSPGFLSGSLLNFSWEKAKVLQAQMSFIHVLGESWFWDDATLTGEVGGNMVTGIDSDKLFNDKSAWGFTLQTAFDYYQIVTGLDLKIPVTLKMNPRGVSSVVGTFREDMDSVGVNMDFTYKNTFQFGFGYTNYLYSAEKNPMADRDFVSANLKYTF